MDFFDATGKKYVLPKNKKISWRISAYAAVLAKDNKLLVVMPHWTSLWELPGGGIESHETIEEGLKREYYEETGYTIALTSLTPFYVGEGNFFLVTEKKFCHAIRLAYKATLADEEQNVDAIHTEDEIQKVEWIALSQLHKNNCHHVAFPIIQSLRKSLMLQ